MSFTLRIVNAPLGAQWWWGEFPIPGTYDLYEGSGWLPISDTWNCSRDPEGTTNLAVLVIDSGGNYLHIKSGLGPVYDGRGYIYNCSTGKLSEETPEAEFTNLEIISLDRR